MIVMVSMEVLHVILRIVDTIDAQNWHVPYLFIQPIDVAHARVHQSKSSTASEITASNKVPTTPLLHMLPPIPIDGFFVADSKKISPSHMHIIRFTIISNIGKSLSIMPCYNY
jgi:hypothetical protein